MAPEARLGEVVVHNGLASTSTTAALSANMGRVLNESIQALDVRVQTLEEAGTGSGSGSDITITLATASDIVALFN